MNLLTPELVDRNVQFARQIAKWIDEHTAYTLLNKQSDPIVPLNIVLFSGAPGSAFAPDVEGSSAKLTAAINGTRKMYVSGTKWRGQGAVRIAISNWRTGRGGEDFKIVTEVLDQVSRSQ